MVATIEQFDFLMTQDRRSLLGEISESESIPALQLNRKLRERYPGEFVAAAMTLHELRVRARTKFSRADEMWFTRAGYEQASSERAAEHRAQRFDSISRIADLCSGIGGDLVSLASKAAVVAVDRDPLHLRMALANAGVYGRGERVSGVEADVREFDLKGYGGVFIDPARRSEQGRLGSNSTEPPLGFCLGLTDRVPAVAIKAAPGIDRDLVPPDWELEFVADGRDLKESVLWSPAFGGVERRATLLPSGETFIPVPGDAVAVAKPGTVLLDPNPAITRAGLVEDLARSIGAWKIDEQIAFLSMDRDPDSIWARSLIVLDSMPWRVKDIAARLRSLDIGAIDIRRRGLAGDVEQIRKQLKLKGSKRATLAMTRVENQPWCVICQDPALER
ncbi:MAG: class I SAM-dependent methyltransferase [Thermomicrobiales bacterium]